MVCFTSSAMILGNGNWRTLIVGSLKTLMSIVVMYMIYLVLFIEQDQQNSKKKKKGKKQGEGRANIKIRSLLVFITQFLEAKTRDLTDIHYYCMYLRLNSPRYPFVECGRQDWAFMALILSEKPYYMKEVLELFNVLLYPNPTTVVRVEVYKPLGYLTATRVVPTCCDVNSTVSKRYVRCCTPSEYW